MGKMIDLTDTNLVLTHSQNLIDDGITAIAGYYFTRTLFKHLLTKEVAVHASSVGLFIVSVWENGSPTHGDYFNTHTAQADAVQALQCAKQAGQPAGTTIYFSVDYDASTADLTAIVNYFRTINHALSGSGYSASCYASGMICSHLKALNLVTHTWLTMSKGFQGYAHWLPLADITQITETQLYGYDVDTNRTNGNAGGWQIKSTK